MVRGHMHIPFVDLRAQYALISQEVEEALKEVLQTTDFILGNELLRFEEEFASFSGVGHCVGLASGTDAIHLALLAIGVGPGDEVIVPAHTFVASAFAVSYTGARPVFVDVNPRTYTIDVDAIEQAISHDTKAIMPVHLYGCPAEMDTLIGLARRHHLRVVEDAAQAHGAEFRQKRCGSIGDVGCFSFYPGKNLGAYGDGGAVVTNDSDVAQAIRRLRFYGQEKKHEHLTIGYNSRLDTLQAAVLRVKLRKLASWNEARRAKVLLYRELLSGVPLCLPVDPEEGIHVYHLFVVRTGHRDALLQFLRENGVMAQVHYPVPVHLQKAYRGLNYAAGDMPIAETCAREVLSLPLYPEITEDQIRYVVTCVKRFYETV